MWILILLICFLSVSGALSAVKYVNGAVGRAITINCRYEAEYRSHTKYWCHGWTDQCSVLVETNEQDGRRGRVSITDNLECGIFTVTMENLQINDTGWYSCGITKERHDPLFKVHLSVFNECVSQPVLRFIPSANASSFQNSLSVSCESVQGSLPIQYTWYEKTLPKDAMISNTKTLDLHCQSFKQQQYYCTASNYCGPKTSEILDVTASNVIEKCTDTSDTTIRVSTGSGNSCESSGTESAIITASTNLEIRDNDRKSLILIIVPSVTGVLVMVFLICLIWFLNRKLKDTKFNMFRRTSKNDIQETTTCEEQDAYATVLEIQSDKTPAQLATKENGAMDETMEFQRKLIADPSVNAGSNIIYTGVKFTNNPPKVYPSPGMPANSTKTIYASIAP